MSDDKISELKIEERAPQKRRSIFFVLYMVYLLFINGSGAVRGIYDFVQGLSPLMPHYFTISCTINIIGIIALLCWKKWGFWLMVANTVIFALIAILNGQISPTILPLTLIGIAFLYGLLIYNKPNEDGTTSKIWTQLE